MQDLIQDTLDLYLFKTSMIWYRLYLNLYSILKKINGLFQDYQDLSPWKKLFKKINSQVLLILSNSRTKIWSLALSGLTFMKKSLKIHDLVQDSPDHSPWKGFFLKNSWFGRVIPWNKSFKSISSLASPEAEIFYRKFRTYHHLWLKFSSSAPAESEIFY